MRCLGWVGFLAFLLGSMTLVALEPLVIYDPFDTDFIDPARWVVSQQGGAVHREYVREIRSGRLRMSDRAYGNTNSDTGGSFDGIFTDFPSPDAVTDLGADVRVMSFEATSCAANPTITSTRAELHGTFFNVATPVAGSHTNDVRASINLQRASNTLDSSDVLRVIAAVRQCLDSSCSTGLNLALQDLGSISVGERTRLLIRWDAVTNQFIFSSNDDTFVAPYAVSDAAPSGAKRKGLLVANFVSNCTATPRPVAFMEASFDRVLVNASAATQ